MATYKFANNAVGYLSAGIGAADVSITLTSGYGDLFPSLAASEQFEAVIVGGGNTEWVTCTARSGETLTVTRGTPAYAFSAGAKIELRLSATALEAMQQQGTERTVTSDPDGSLTANYTGEEVYNSTTGVWWKHCTGTTWKAMNA